MKILIKIAFTIVLLLTFSTSTDLFAHGSRLSIKNVHIPQPNLMTGGQPSKYDLNLLARKGVKVVINLRAKGEFNDFDEEAEAKKQGLKYHSLEISGDEEITRENAIKLDKLIGKETTLVHCASGNRVGALLALREYFVKGKPAEVAMAFGKKLGLTGLTEKTAQVIKQVSTN